MQLEKRSKNGRSSTYRPAPLTPLPLSFHPIGMKNNERFHHSPLPFATILAAVICLASADRQRAVAWFAKPPTNTETSVPSGCRWHKFLPMQSLPSLQSGCCLSLPQGGVDVRGSAITCNRIDEVGTNVLPSSLTFSLSISSSTLISLSQ